MDPPKNSRDKIENRLRIQELTASLDGLTGSMFSGAIRRDTLDNVKYYGRF
jgi:hypothetical protein